MNYEEPLSNPAWFIFTLLHPFCIALMLYFVVEGGGGVALQSHPLWHPAHLGRHDVHRQHPQPLRHQHRQVGECDLTRHFTLRKTPGVFPSPLSVTFIPNRERYHKDDRESIRPFFTLHPPLNSIIHRPAVAEQQKLHVLEPSVCLQRVFYGVLAVIIEFILCGSNRRCSTWCSIPGSRGRWPDAQRAARQLPRPNCSGILRLNQFRCVELSIQSNCFCQSFRRRNKMHTEVRKLSWLHALLI